VKSVKIFVGGLPQHPKPPLNYHIVYSLEGVLDYYTTLSWVIRDGKRRQVKALSELETVSFDGIGALEAFHTAGGLSTIGFRYEGKIATMEYKTLRYPGHAHIMEAVRDLGLLDLAPIDVKGAKVSPRDVAVAVMGPKLREPNGRDLLALRVVVRGHKDGKPVTHTFELVDRYDETTGITAMERTTGFSLSITGLLQGQGRVTPAGVHTPDECMPGDIYVAELAKRGMHIKQS
jgi:lysine 6-dehydrogenase